MTTKLKLLLVECDPGNTLGGSCVRDVHNFAQHFLEKSMLKTDEIDITITLTDMSKAHHLTGVKYEPSTKILEILDSIILVPGDTFVVLLSGHGYTTRDTSGDEDDGLDEYINVGFTVLDDVLYEKIVKKHNLEAVKLVLLSDTCHSGTMFDLPFRIDNNTKTKTSRRDDHLVVSALSVSACTDSQLSMCDVGEVGYGGSLTVGLLEHPEVLDDLLAGKYDKIHLLFDRLRMLNQTGLLCCSF